MFAFEYVWVTVNVIDADTVEDIYGEIDMAIWPTEATALEVQKIHGGKVWKLPVMTTECLDHYINGDLAGDGTWYGEGDSPL